MAFELSPRQAEGRNVLAGPERHNLLVGGSRSGKTFLACYCIGNRALMAPGSRHLISRLHNIDVRQSVMMDTWPKMMRLAFPDVRCQVNKSDQFILVPTVDPDEPAEVWFSGLDDKDRVDKILGKEYATIYVNESSQVAYETILTLRTRLAQKVMKRDRLGIKGQLKLKAYYDLNPTGQAHWSYQEFIAGKRPDNGLPIEPGSRAHIFMNPADNPNLPAEYLAELDALPERQRKRFKEGAYLTEVPGALWPLDVIERSRIPLGSVPQLTRIVVAVDPSGSDGIGGDRQGIVVVGLGVDGRAYVLADISCRKDPAGWGQVVVDAYRTWGADLIVAEVNYGGAMVVNTIRTVDDKLPVKAMHASRGKHVRAEPVASLYTLGKVSHVGIFRDLEEQMSMFTSAGFQGGGSPDRADAMVWGLTELMLGDLMDGWGAFELARQQAAASQAKSEQQHGAPDDVAYAPGSVEYMMAMQSKG